MSTTTPEMHVTHWGDTGPTVVMVHGSAQGSQVGGDRHFAKQKELVAQGWQVLLPDRPGHGKSPDPGRPDDADADGALVAELLGDGAHLVGHSFGGAVALAAAAQRPEAVRSLTLIEPAMQLFAMDDPEVRKMGLKVVSTLFLTFNPTKRLNKFMEIVKMPPEIREASDSAENAAIGRSLRKLKMPNKKAIAKQLDIVRDNDIPLLLVSGSWSDRMQRIGTKVADAGGGRMEIIRSDHHFPQLVSDEFNTMLVEHMTAADAR
ncbi:MAG: alpha/beta hydrolase [Ilumatobacteraceae bacterium]